MRIVKHFILLLSLFLIPNIAKAGYGCTVEELSNLKRIASNITTKYDYIETFSNNGYGNVSFTFTISNVPNEMYLRYYEDEFETKNYVTYYPDSNNQIIIKGMQAGKSYRYSVYSKTNTKCNEELLNNFYVTPPSYNKFYIHDLCKDIQSYSSCQKWTKTSFGDDEAKFKYDVKKYLQSLEVEKPPEEEHREDPYGWFVELIAFLDKYIFIITVPIIALCIIGMIIYNKKTSFNLKVK